jgi:hypothetical protein
VNLQAFKTKDGHFRLKKQSSEDFKAFLTGLKPMADFSIKILSDKEKRSLQQSRYYWSMVLPTCQYHLNALEWCCQPLDKEIAHYQLKLDYCVLQRPDLIEVNKFKDPKTKEITERAVPFSWAIDKMPQKEANAFIEFCMNLVTDQTKHTWEDCIRETDL